MPCCQFDEDKQRWFNIGNLQSLDTHQVKVDNGPPIEVEHDPPRISSVNDISFILIASGNHFLIVKHVSAVNAWVTVDSANWFVTPAQQSINLDPDVNDSNSSKAIFQTQQEFKQFFAKCIENNWVFYFIGNHPHRPNKLTDDHDAAMSRSLLLAGQILHTRGKSSSPALYQGDQHSHHHSVTSHHSVINQLISLLGVNPAVSSPLQSTTQLQSSIHALNTALSMLQHNVPGSQFACYLYVPGQGPQQPMCLTSHPTLDILGTTIHRFSF